MKSDDLTKMMRQVFMLVHYWEGIIDAGLRDAGLTAKQLFMLSLMEREFSDPPSISELAAGTLTSHQNVMQMAKSLQRSGFVSIEDDPADRRVKKVHLTRHHRSFWEERGGGDEQKLQQLFDPLSETEQQHLSSALDTLVPVIAERYRNRYGQRDEQKNEKE